MNNGLRDAGILDAIRELSAQRASGRLQINTGMTEGALFFARGQLVDARLGRLKGFQAINALVSVPDASYNFDPSIAPPAQSSIAPNERLLLKDFFGIEVVNGEHANDVAANWLEDESAPEQVVPLAEVAETYPDDQQLPANEEEEVTLVRPNPVVAETRPEPILAERQYERAVPEYRDEPFVAEPARGRIFAEPRPALANRPVTRSRFLPALFVALVTVLVAAAAVVLLNRLRKPDATASVAPAVQTSPPAGTQPSQPVTQPTQQDETSRARAKRSLKTGAVYLPQAEPRSR